MSRGGRGGPTLPGGDRDRVDVLAVQVRDVQVAGQLAQLSNRAHADNLLEVVAGDTKCANESDSMGIPDRQRAPNIDQAATRIQAYTDAHSCVQTPTAVGGGGSVLVWGSMAVAGIVISEVREGLDSKRNQIDEVAGKKRATSLGSSRKPSMGNVLLRRDKATPAFCVQWTTSPQSIHYYDFRFESSSLSQKGRRKEQGEERTSPTGEWGSPRSGCARRPTHAHPAASCGSASP